MSMYIYIWNRVEYLTNSLHHEGGLVVIAATPERVRELIEEATKDVEGTCEALERVPDHKIKCASNTKERVIIFPDEGCC